MNPPSHTTPVTGRVVGARDSFVVVELEPADAVRKNEVGHVLVGSERLQCEVLRVRGRQVDMQVFEDTRGIRTGDPVEFSGSLLSATLGPGLLGSVFDGLQNPLTTVAGRHGSFLPRGISLPALDPERSWSFTPLAKAGQSLLPGGVVGTVPEGAFVHRLMVPFHLNEPVEVVWVSGERSVKVTDPVARCRTRHGGEFVISASQSWPVRRPLPGSLLRQRHAERLYPEEALTTGCRTIDSFFPVARGGTACIPGPFGAGKTVLQSSIARYSDVDIVVMVACGERAGEVTETLTSFPQLRDPEGGGTLMDRTVVVCNTSAMPVAAREASIYLGVTLAEYYRQMGYAVLLLADSTSRWAQAMREISGRMEEIPGEEGFPAYLDSSIKGIYERAGVIRCGDGRVGSLTLIGTVSPAGGNFEEPVTQSTLGTVKAFLGLSRDRAYKRFYPAVDPLESWSRYRDQLAPWFESRLGADWTGMVDAMRQLLHDGDAVEQIMQVTGEEGVTLEDFVVLQKARFLDLVFLQQDAFDAVDGATPRERQAQSLGRIRRIIDSDRKFTDKEEARQFFGTLTHLFRNWNYSAPTSPDYNRWWEEITRHAGLSGGADHGESAPEINSARG